MNEQKVWEITIDIEPTCINCPYRFNYDFWKQDGFICSYFLSKEYNNGRVVSGSCPPCCEEDCPLKVKEN